MLQIHWCQQLTCGNMQVSFGFRCLFNTFSHFIEQNKNNNKINWRYKVISRVSSPVCAVSDPSTNYCNHDVCLLKRLINYTIIAPCFEARLAFLQMRRNQKKTLACDSWKHFHYKGWGRQTHDVNLVSKSFQHPPSSLSTSLPLCCRT